MISPAPLSEGATVAVTATSGPPAPDRLAAGLAVLASWGLRFDVLESVGSVDGYLAGPDSLRRSDLQRALVDDGYQAVVIARGGFGTQRILDGVDWGAVSRARPRQVVGFSDVTALHQALRLRVGWGSVHGPVVTSLGDATDAALGRLRDVLFEPQSLRSLLVGEQILPGAAVGPLVGGNLAMLATSIGTPDAGSAEGAVVALEDVAETPYRIDRLLTQLTRSGWMDGARGVVCGGFTDCGDDAELRELFRRRLEPLGIPVLWGAGFGHLDENLAFPLGAEVTLTDGVLRLADSSVD
jgi:muramoyltetrapeptide carboxypeptidase